MLEGRTPSLRDAMKAIIDPAWPRSLDVSIDDGLTLGDFVMDKDWDEPFLEVENRIDASGTTR
jgi:hypothetical protein